MSEIVRVLLDVERRMWEVHVLTGFSDGPAGADVVVVVHASHALCAGHGVGLSVQNVLFGADLPLPELPGADDDSTRRAALRGALRLPGDPVSFVRSMTRVRRNPSPVVPLIPKRLLYNAIPGSRRAVRVLVFEAGGIDNALPLALSAISSAMAEHAEVHGDTAVRDNLAAYVTLVLPQAVPWSATNRFVSATVPLHAGIEDRDQRARAIRSSIGAARKAAFTPEFLARYEVVETLPPAVVSRLIRRGSRRKTMWPTMGGHTVISTALRPAAEMTSIGAAYRFSTGSRCSHRESC